MRRLFTSLLASVLILVSLATVGLAQPSDAEDLAPAEAIELQSSDNVTVTVPLLLPVSVDKNGIVSVSDDAKITNNGTGMVKVTSARINPYYGWTLVPFDHDFGQDKVGQQNMAVQINGQSSPDGNISIADWYIDNGSSSPIIYDCKFSAIGGDVASKAVARVEFTVESVEVKTLDLLEEYTIDPDAVLTVVEPVE